MNIKELKKQSKSLKPIINIGKNGTTDSQINHINEILKKKKLIKVKFIQSALEGKDKKELVDELMKKIDGELVDFVGFSITLYKR